MALSVKEKAKLYLNKNEYNRLFEVLSLNERGNDTEKSQKATNLKEKLVRFASVLDKREQDYKTLANISIS